MCVNSVLKLPNFQLLFLLQVDAFQSSVCAILWHIRSNGVEYASQKLLDRERIYLPQRDNALDLYGHEICLDLT